MLDSKELLKKLTIYQKASLLVGYQNMATRPVKPLAIPSLIMSDGPNGVRKESEDSVDINNTIHTLPATCFPCGSALACSFDNDLLFEVGSSIAQECLYYDINVLLGPAINIKRNPLCGRNFEYLSEDPYLTGTLCSNFVNGLQQNKVLACLKHYAGNNLEDYRYIGDSIIDLKALNEIYLKGYQITINNSHPGLIMTAYNKVNGYHASENKYLLKDILRDKYHYDGLTITDWGGMVNRDISLNMSQDLEMPGMIEENILKIVKGVESGLIKEATLDESVSRLLETINKTRVKTSKNPQIFDENKEIALKSAIKSAVLLKNENDLLPLDKNKEYVIIGDLFNKMRYQGGGSSLINAYDVIDNKKAFDNHEVKYRFYQGYEENKEKINSKLEIEAINGAKDADVILFFGGLTDLSESEGFDRKDMKLPINQIHLIDELVKQNKKIVFIMFGGSPFEIPSIDRLNSLLFMNLPGEMGGEACYKLLFGEASPSGHLAFTWMNRYEDVPYYNEYDSSPIELYKESIYVGYRYYSSFDKKVLFPFGYGLTYGKYHFYNLYINNKDNKEIIVSFKVKNDSDISIEVVPQIYVGMENSSLPRSKYELKAYKKVALSSLEEKEVSLTIKVDDLKVYELSSNLEKIEDGDYIFYLNDDVNHIYEQKKIHINGEKLSLKENEDVYLSKDITHIDNETYFSYLGRKVEPYKPHKPYTMETPIYEFNTFFGKIIKKAMLHQGDKVIKSAKKCKDEQEKVRVIKSGTFMKKMILSNCLRSLCYSAGGKMTLKTAEGILLLVNGHVFKALKKFL